MLLSERIVHGMFNAALTRLNVRHICPLPVPMFACGTALVSDGTTTTSGQAEYPLRLSASDPTELLSGLVSWPSHHHPQQQQQQQERHQQQQQQQKPAKKQRTKRPRPVPVDEGDQRLEAAADIVMPDDLAQLLDSRVPMPKEGEAQIDPESQEGKLLLQQQPNKKYSCTQYSPEFVAWLDRACLALYNLLEKRPIVTAATGKDREEFARLTEERGLTLPLDMRCTGCRRRFKLKTWRETQDSSVQKCMTHPPDSTRASHCLRCRLVDWVLSDRQPSLHPARLIVIPVAASDDPPQPVSTEKKKRKRNRKPLSSSSSSSSSPEIKQEEDDVDK